MNTIFALASARGKAGVAVMRISGFGAFEAAAQLTSLPPPRKAALRTLRAGGVLLDEAVVLVFPGPGSFTGEDVVELHLHGSQATIAAVSAALANVGVRQAEPGEFTRRALENERLDLAQVEGLADLLEAETESQRRQALRVLSGALGERAQTWRARLIRAAALIEATIDFADEEVPTDVYPEVRSLIDAVSADLRRELSGAGAAERIREGFEVAIVGPPNVGKSSLLNALAGRDAAITSEIAGTTRDVIEVRMDIAGLAVTLLDTAGIRDAEGKIEAIGIERARERAEAADLRLFLTEPGKPPVMAPVEGDIVIASKADIRDGDISTVTGQGLDDLMERVQNVLLERASGAGLVIRERHRVAFENAVKALESASDRLETTPELAELLAEDLRLAIGVLDSLVGQVGVEDLLDEIFASFCIGK